MSLAGSNAVRGPDADDRPLVTRLLAAKLSVPGSRGPVVDRPRLAALVSRGVEGPLTVVSGPAGSGKTLLLTAWLAAGRARGPVAWLTLESSDGQPGVFWSYVIAALRRAGVTLPDDVAEPIRAERVDHLLLTRVADGLAGHPVPVVLVLDQFDVVTERAVREQVDFVLSNAAPMLRLVLLTRNDGPLLLHRYELRGDLVRIRNSDLAFTTEEAAALLDQHGVRLSPAGLAAVTDHTRGWAAGLRLSAVAMQRRADKEAFAAALPAAGSALRDYLVHEVLEVQPQTVRQFLLRTCLADRLSPALADALTGRHDGEDVLASLHTGNVLTEMLEEAPGWYRYHPLLAYVLRRELRREHPELVPDLHRRASVWFDGAGLLAEAVQHASAAGDWRLAAATVVRNLGIAALLAGGPATHLDLSLAELPLDAEGAMPAVVRAAQAMARFDVSACRDQLALAEAEADAERGADRTALLASVAVLRAIVARTSGDLAAAETAVAHGEAHLSRLGDLALRRPELRALLLSNVGTVQLWRGRFADADTTLRRGLAVSDAPGCEYPRLNMLGRLALAEFREGRLRRAARLAEQDLSLAEEIGLPVHFRTGAGDLTLALVAVEWRDAAAVRRHLDHAQRSVGARHDPFVSTLVPLLHVAQYTASRNFPRALAALDQVPATVAGQPLPPWLATWVAVTGAMLHLRRGQVSAATSALESAPERGPGWVIGRAMVALATGDSDGVERLIAPLLGERSPGQDAAAIDAWLLRARLDLAAQERRAACDALRQALVLARPEGYRRPFADAGTWVRELFRSVPELAEGHRWLGPPFADRPSRFTVPGTGTERGAPRTLVEPLTKREQAVLTRMAQAMSTQDIADDLYLSVNTVKTHQRSIYRKLSVGRRNEAVRKARHLGLV